MTSPNPRGDKLPPIIDTHCHLDLDDYDRDRPEVIRRARDEGLAGFINVGFNLPSSSASIDLAQARADFWATVGVHPHEAGEVGPGTLARLRDLALKTRVVAIGEIGLDFYRDLSPRPAQRDAFRRQLRLARELRKPVVIHDRDAHDEVLRILEEEAAGLTVILHCFSGDVEMARTCLAAGYFLAIGGAVTFDKAKKTQEVAAFIPLNRLILETDAPYLSPEPFRGKRNEPARVAAVAAKVAEVRGESPAVIRAETTRTACRAFGLTLGG